MVTCAYLTECALEFDARSPGVIDKMLLNATGTDFRERDMLAKLTALIEVYGIAGAARLLSTEDIE